MSKTEPSSGDPSKTTEQENAELAAAIAAIDFKNFPPTILGQTERMRTLALRAEGTKNASGLGVAVRAEQEINRLQGFVVANLNEFKITSMEDLDDQLIETIIKKIENLPEDEENGPA